MLNFVKKRGLEGVVAKRSDSIYQPGQRSGLWTKHRLNLGREFVIGGFVPSNLGVDALIVGFYRGPELIYSARVRSAWFRQLGVRCSKRSGISRVPSALSSIFLKLAPAGGARGSQPRR